MIQVRIALSLTGLNGKDPVPEVMSLLSVGLAEAQRNVSGDGERLVVHEVDIEDADA